MYKSETILKVLKENNHIFSGKVIDMLEENIREEAAKSSGKKSAAMDVRKINNGYPIIEYDRKVTKNAITHSAVREM